LQHAPAIGGRETLRGYQFQRYAGESSAFGSAEVRVPVGTVPFVLRWHTGIFGLVDVGRVWFEQQSPGGWHSGVGGGLWFSSLGQTFSVAYAHGEQSRFYLQRGMSF
jgi:hemolysin activation/secretion protein